MVLFVHFCNGLVGNWQQLPLFFWPLPLRLQSTISKGLRRTRVVIRFWFFRFTKKQSIFASCCAIYSCFIVDVIIVIVVTKRLIVTYYSCLSYSDHGWHKKDQTSIIITYCYCSMICCIRFGSSFIIFHHFLLSGWPATKATLAMPQRCPRSKGACVGTRAETWGSMNSVYHHICHYCTT